MLRWCAAILCLFSVAAQAQQLPCDHVDRVTPEIKIPNVFSPNGDGINDLFRAEHNIEYFSNYTLHVYNRAGQLVFFADRPAQGWDGRTPSGTPCPEGVYFYITQYNTGCEEDRAAGVIELVR